VIDLRGRTVVPGLIDGHAHMDSMWRQYPSLADCQSIADVQERIAQKAAQTEPGQWLIFRQLADPEPLAPRNLKEQRFPTREDLDKAAPRHPVWIRGSYITPSVVNSLALEFGSITRQTPQPERLVPTPDGRTGDVNPSTGGRIDKDPRTGEPTGLLHDFNTLLARPATAPLWKLVPQHTYADRVRNIEDGVREFNALGITAVHEGHGVADPVELSHRAYLDVWSREKLTVRTNMVTNVRTNGTAEDIVARIESMAHAAHAGAGDDYFRFGGIGVTLDGPGGAGDSYHPKAESWDGPRDELRNGVQRVSAEKFMLVCREAARRGMRMSTKAGGEPMVELLLDTYAEVDREFRIRDRRWVMFHSQFTHPGQMARLRDLGVSPITCATFLWNHGESFVRYYGEDVALRSVPFRSFLDAGLAVSNGTDTTPKNPFISLWLMITRTVGETGRQMGDAQKVSRQEALRIATNHGAYLLQMEDRLGSLEPGMYADLVVLSEDYLTVPDARIRDISAVMTMVGGQIAHTAEG
jgi:predicted amidohydrolase YtcJ